MAPIGNNSFRAIAITIYRAKDGTLEHAQAVAPHNEALLSDQGEAHAGRSRTDLAMISFPMSHARSRIPTTMLGGRQARGSIQ